MKKLVLFSLCSIFAFSFTACDKKDGGNAHGEPISSQAAQTLLAGISSRSEELNAEGLNKLTYTLKMQMDDECTTSTHKFSKDDHYMYDYIQIENSDVYWGYEVPYKEYQGTIHNSVTKNYFYVDSTGRAIDAAYHFYDQTMKDEETGEFERTSNSERGYKILAETQEESEQIFHNSILTQLSDIMTQLLSYTSQMVQTFEPLLEMGSISAPGMSIEIKSNGDGHLYMKEDMSSYGVYYECEFNDYMLTYMKTITDNSVTGMTAVGYEKITTEMFFSFGVCELSYPNLSDYAQNN